MGLRVVDTSNDALFKCNDKYQKNVCSLFNGGRETYVQQETEKKKNKIK